MHKRQNSFQIWLFDVKSRSVNGQLNNSCAYVRFIYSCSLRKSVFLLINSERTTRTSKLYFQSPQLFVITVCGVDFGPYKAQQSRINNAFVSRVDFLSLMGLMYFLKHLIRNIRHFLLVYLGSVVVV